MDKDYFIMDTGQEGITMWRPFGQSRFLQKQLQTRWQRLYRIVYSWCHDPDLASDLVQETMRKALRKSDQLKKSEAMNAWLLAILTNCWRDHCRKHRETTVFDEALLADETSGEEDGERILIVTQVRKAIAKLSREQREVVTLVDLEGLSYSEVAEVLDIPIGTVMSRLCRARRQLKTLLEATFTDEEPSAPNLRRIK
ncbi:MAG: sigma-70 family RNA polymerase sigma factor [Gammaproteobacteria bacterium]